MSTIGNQISINNEKDCLAIDITAKEDKVKSTMLLAWLFLWSVAGVLVLTQYFTVQEPDIKAVLIVWMGFWCYFEYKIVKVYFWRRYGKEELKIENGNLFYKKSIRGKGKERIYDCKSIKNIQSIDEDDTSFLDSMNNSYWTMAGETIQFDYGELRPKLGLQLDKKDVKDLLPILKRATAKKK